MDENLYKRSLWRNEIYEYLFGAKIIEYDMKSAGLNLVKQFNLLPRKVIEDLENTEKHQRAVKLGLIQRKNPEFAQKLSDAFKEGRRLFFQANELNEKNLLSIKKDAFFTVDKICDVTEFGEIHFVEKNKYTSFFYLNKLEFYFNTLLGQIDIKGLGQGDALEEVLSLHGDYLLDFMKRFCRMKEIMADKNMMDLFLSKFVRDYRNRELPVEYYRELDKGLSYRIYSEELEEYTNVKETTELDKLDIRKNYFDYIVPLVNLCI